MLTPNRIDSLINLTINSILNKLQIQYVLVNNKLKKVQKKYKISTMKITPNNNSENKNSHSESIKNSTLENGSIKQKNSYPSDIQGLFERLGID